MSNAGRPTIRDIVIRSKVVEKQIKSPIFQRKNNQGIKSNRPSFDVAGMVLD
jgi:hypothetical protein